MEEAEPLLASVLLAGVLSVTFNRVSRSEVACPHIAIHDRAAPALVFVACSSCVVRWPGEEMAALVAAALIAAPIRCADRFQPPLMRQRRQIGLALLQAVARHLPQQESPLYGVPWLARSRAAGTPCNVVAA